MLLLQDGQTLFAIAVANGQYAIAAELLNKGADPTAKDKVNTGRSAGGPPNATPIPALLYLCRLVSELTSISLLCGVRVAMIGGPQTDLHCNRLRRD